MCCLPFPSLLLLGMQLPIASYTIRVAERVMPWQVAHMCMYQSLPTQNFLSLDIFPMHMTVTVESRASCTCSYLPWWLYVKPRDLSPVALSLIWVIPIHLRIVMIILLRKMDMIVVLFVGHNPLGTYFICMHNSRGVYNIGFES